jgi:hypothetical protein
MTPNATDTEGKYVASINVVDGEIIIVYGNEAHGNINSEGATPGADTLVLTPFLSGDESVVWKCGLAATGSGLSSMEGGADTSGTNVPPQYLPSACRP